MASELISDLTAATAVTRTSQFEIEDAGNSLSATTPLIARYVNTTGVSVEDFGAVGDGTTDDSTAIQAAIDDVSGDGGGFVFFGQKTYAIGSTLTLPSGVILSGAGINATTITLLNSSNVDMVRSTNFATLTGTNQWLVSAGVQHGLGFQDLQFDGNKANQTSGDGIKLYAKRIHVRNVLIRDVEGVGWFSEAGDVGGQADWEDLPEGNIGNLRIRNCGSHGFQFRGPHDANIESLFVNESGGDGIRIERSVGVYSGICDIGFVHVYANDARGFYVDSATNIRAREIISESNDQEGLVIEGTRSQISVIQLFGNCRVSGTFQCVLSGAFNTIDNLQIKDSSSDTGGLQITSNSNQIRNLFADGLTSSGTGVSVGTGEYNYISGRIDGYSSVGGVGLITNNGGQSRGNQFHLNITDCATIWNNAAIGVMNRYFITFFANSGQTHFTGSGPNAVDQRETWDIKGEDSSGNTYLSEVRKRSGAALDLNVTTEQTINIAHELIATPELEDVQVSFEYTGTNTTFAIQYMRVISVTSTLVNIRFKLSTAAGAAETGRVLMQVKL